MKGTFRILLLSFLIVSNLNDIYAQTNALGDSGLLNLKSYFEQSYGTDYNLVNGIRYINRYPLAEGHPYLGDDRFYKGSLVINGRAYREVELKYDICTQEIILKYPYFTGSTDQIILVKDFIHEFELDGKRFRKYYFSGTDPNFYQVVTGGKIYCLYLWKKDLLTGSSVQSFHKYSPEIRKSFLVIDNEYLPFRSRRSFVKLFPADCQQEILFYFKSEKINLKDPGEANLTRLMNYCNDLIKGN